ncbi:hypothetical protein M404DRAFT_726496 [Pisolithus tinctorius Marx 270]|uniref:Secreted protein n=1 Tax=Pisolithus tinctorius Marx 270 TaxID=870435 RepID=A0A0C3IXF1_PISTI|nr:hypothetical protein M404DRAFT_726496 [Pisolithus tinctorius Marx 270]
MSTARWSSVLLCWSFVLPFARHVPYHTSVICPTARPSSALPHVRHLCYCTSKFCVTA